MCLTTTLIGGALHRPLPGSRLQLNDSTATEHSSQCGISTALISVMGQNRQCSDDRSGSNPLRFLEKKTQMVRRDFFRAVPETFAMVGWSTVMRMVAVAHADPETSPNDRGPEGRGGLDLHPSIDGALCRHRDTLLLNVAPMRGHALVLTNIACQSGRPCGCAC
jgi:hypothetical protein